MITIRNSKEFREIVKEEVEKQFKIYNKGKKKYINEYNQQVAKIAICTIASAKIIEIFTDKWTKAK